MRDALIILAHELAEACLASGDRIATAESCTGGLISALCTSVEGSSDWFDRGFVTYSNDAKIEMLGVPELTLVAHAAVSEETAAAMAAGALAHSQASFAVSVTGIAGPGGGSEDKPVGMVCFGFASSAGLLEVCTEHFKGDRTAVREAAVVSVMRRMLTLLQ